MKFQVIVMPNGRMSLPAAMRRRLGLEGGGSVLVEETADGVMLRTVGQAVARAPAVARQYRDHPDAWGDAFLVRRRAGSVG